MVKYGFHSFLVLRLVNQNASFEFARDALEITAQNVGQVPARAQSEKKLALAGQPSSVRDE